MFPLHELPKELLILISSFLEPYSLLALAATSHQFYALLRLELRVVLEYNLGSDPSTIDDTQESALSLPAIDGARRPNCLIIRRQGPIGEPDVPQVQDFLNRFTNIREVRLQSLKATSTLLTEMATGVDRLSVEHLSFVWLLRNPLPSSQLQKLQNLQRLSVRLFHLSQYENSLRIDEFPSNFHDLAPHLSWLSISIRGPFTKHYRAPSLRAFFSDVTLSRLTCFILTHSTTSNLKQWRWTNEDLSHLPAFIDRHSRTLISLTLPHWSLPSTTEPDHSVPNAFNNSCIKNLTIGREFARLFTITNPLRGIRRLTIDDGKRPHTAQNSEESPFHFPSLVGLQVLRLVLRYGEQTRFEQLPQSYPEIVELHVNLRNFHSGPSDEVSEDVLCEERRAILLLLDDIEALAFLAKFPFLRQTGVWLPVEDGKNVGKVRQIKIKRDGGDKMNIAVYTFEDWPCTWSED